MNVLMVDRLPSAHKSNTNYKVAILYRPTNLPCQVPNTWHGYPGESGRIRAVSCGPSNDRNCIIGSRIEPCAHGATALKIGCIIPLDQVYMLKVTLLKQNYHDHFRMHSTQHTEISTWWILVTGYPWSSPEIFLLEP